MSLTTRSKFFTVLILLLGVLFSVSLLRLSIAKTQATATAARGNAATQNGNIKQSGAHSCPTCPTPKQQIIYVPVFDLPEASSSEINLNCRSSHQMEVTPTFYTMEGTPVVGEVIHLQPSEIRFVDTKSLIPAEYRQQRRWGGMSLSYTGQYMEAWAQLTLHGIDGGGSANVLFSVLNDVRSNAQAAVWWVPQDGEAAIAMGNSSGERIRAMLEFSDGESRNVELAPFATEIVRRRADGRGGRANLNGKGESIIINSTGVAGSLIARGIVGSADGKFTGSIRFYDTQNVFQSNLYATNFRLKDVVPHVLLRNTAASAISVRPRFLPEAGASGNPVELPTMKLEPNETAEVNLDVLMTAIAGRPDLAAVGVQIINSGVPGSLIGSLYGTDKKTGAVYDVPLRDSGAIRNSAGGYPVRLDGDYSTIVSITNASEVATEFTAQVNYEGGPYLLHTYKLSAGETTIIDFRKIRDEQIPDWKGHTLPQSFTRGQFRWGIHGGGSDARLLGRAEVISKSEHVSSSYSCGVICPASYAYSNLNIGSVLVDGFEAMYVEELDRDCYFSDLGPYEKSPDYFTSYDASIASVTEWYGHVMGVAPGETQIYAFSTTTIYHCERECYPEDIPVEAISQVFVSPVKFTRVAQDFGTANFDEGFARTFNAALSLPSNSPPCTGSTFSMRVYLEKGVNVTLVPGTDARTNISTADDSQYRISGGGLTTESASSPNPSFNALLKRISPNNPNRAIVFTVGSKDQSGRFNTTPGRVTITCN